MEWSVLLSTYNVWSFFLGLITHTTILVFRSLNVTILFECVVQDYHYGHTCPYGGRGSWKPEGVDAEVKIEPMTIIKSLTDKESLHARKHGCLPPARTAVYIAHNAIKEPDYLSFWEVGSTVTDDHKHLITWATSMSSWSHSDGADDGKSAENEAEDAAAQEDSVAQMSLISDKIALLRSELDELEKKKEDFGTEDTQRQKMLIEVDQKHNALEESVSQRIEALAAVYQKCKTYVMLCGVADESTFVLAGDVSKRIIGPHCGRDTAFALAWLEINGPSIEAAGSHLEFSSKELLKKHTEAIFCELAFLKQMALAAKVVARVTSAVHKKLLNLCHTWLKTMMPYCLAKINRVSFGLLTEEDCKLAIAADPHVPRSRLKLGVPFVGTILPRVVY